jgi:hypothetical protein
MIKLQTSNTNQNKPENRSRPYSLLDIYDFSDMHMNINTCPKLRDQALPQYTEQNVAKGLPQS